MTSPMEAPKGQFLSLNETTNALDYLERAVSFLKETPDSHKAWKWVVIALHGALHGFAVAAAKGTDETSLLGKNGKMLGFWDILKLCQDPQHMRMLVHSRHLTVTDSQRDSIDLLKASLRNEFEHFSPKVWGIELHGMPQITIDVLDVIGFLAVETHTYVHLSPDQQEQVRRLVEDGKKFAAHLKLHKEALLGQELFEREQSKDSLQETVT